MFRDQADLKFELRRQKGLLGAKVLKNSMSNALKKWKKANFSHLVNQLKNDDNQIGSILALRKLCLNYNRKRQQKYFDLWYQRGLKPYHLQYLNKNITDHQLKH